MSTIGFDELARLRGEPLPERTLLSLVSLAINPPGGHGGAPVDPGAAGHPAHDAPGGAEDTAGAAAAATSSSSAHAAGPGGDDHTTVAYACQTTHTDGTGGLVGALGLGTPAHSSTTCMPAVVTHD